ERLERRDRLRPPLELGVRLVDDGGRYVVFPSGDDEERRARVVLEVDLGRRAWVEVCERSLKEDAARAGHGVSLVGAERLGFVDRVGEGIVELVGRERDGAVVVRRVLEGRPAGADLR